MTIDERIGALTQSVELLASLHRDTEKHLAEFAERTEQHIGKLADAMTQLAHIVTNHEQRIKRLES